MCGSSLSNCSSMKTINPFAIPIADASHRFDPLVRVSHDMKAKRKMIQPSKLFTKAICFSSELQRSLR